jgi:hypothetical protein
MSTDKYMDELVFDMSKRINDFIGDHCLDTKEIDCFCNKLVEAINDIKKTSEGLLIMKELKENMGRDSRKDFDYNF